MRFESGCLQGSHQSEVDKAYRTASLPVGLVKSLAGKWPEFSVPLETLLEMTVKPLGFLQFRPGMIAYQGSKGSRKPVNGFFVGKPKVLFLLQLLVQVVPGFGVPAPPP